jgi:pyridoxine 4-dehydrogenase
VVIDNTFSQNQQATIQLAGKTVPRIGYGTMRLTGTSVLGPPADLPEALQVLKRAIKLGVRVLDTAWYYGPDIPNQLVAKALYPYPDDLLIVTKLGWEYDAAGHLTSAHSPDNLRQGMERDLRLLKLNSIPIVHLRWHDDPALSDSFKQALDAMMDMQRLGKLQHIGLSNVSQAQVAYALTKTAIATVSNLYNLFDQHDSAMVDFTATQGIAYLPYLPLGSRSADRSGILLKWSAQLDATPAQVALAWLLQQSPNIVPIPGTASISHLEENIAALNIELPKDAIRQLSGMGSK